MRVVKPPASWATVDFTVFLAGSIEMGAATDWQTDLAERLADIDRLTILNPRRDDWDSSWEQKIENDQFREQVEWEIDGFFAADLTVFYFDPGTKSPITLLEFGLKAASRGVVVCCPEGYWRKGNVDIVCKRFGIPQVPDISSLEGHIRECVS